MIREFVTVAGLRTHYWHAGSGPVLLMLHGQLPGSCAAVEWGDQVQRFADAGYSVYAIDEAGFGQTDNPSDYSIETRIAHARAFVDHIEGKLRHLRVNMCTSLLTLSRSPEAVCGPDRCRPIHVR